ncbi:MAG TPA: L-rhamnose/proton symporter RhaT [Terriglobia bacterium]|nr:L-rhamnose/proton symporter RhaT [Terriglobia bacterium]
MRETIGLGFALVLLGGVLQGSFAVPMKRMPAWHWENTWLIYSVAGMVAAPWLLVWATIPHPGLAISGASGTTLAEVMLFGFGWGVGSTLFGLGISRVGMALGFAIILGLTSSLGSLLPLIVLQPERLFTRQGYALLGGLALALLGTALCSIAGHRRERELSTGTRRAGGSGFWVGVLICILSGIFSPMLNFSFVFGKPIQDLALATGARPAMASNPIWALALSAGFLANAGYCVVLLRRNRTWGVFAEKGIPSLYWLGAILMGTIWFAGIAVYGMGAADLGVLGAVIGWPLFMAMIIIAANLWGAATGEWKGASRLTYSYSWAGLAVLLIAIYVISRGSAS